MIFHVSPDGHDRNEGTPDLPLRTIAAAAATAQAGDTIVIGAGIYRERVDPPRGGTGADQPITYTAAPGAHVVLTGSDIFTSWARLHSDVWQLVIPSSYFDDFNPYAETVHGDWFDNYGRTHHRGNVFLDGEWLPEVTTEEALVTGNGLGWTSTVDGLIERPVPGPDEVEGHAAFDPAEFDRTGKTTLTARFPAGTDPNRGRVEVSVRATVFTPTAEHIDYITVQGLELRNAATNWASPTAGQEGLITPYWSRGWVIANNEICYSRCCGIALAKNHDEYDGERGTTDGYYLTILDAQDRDGWSHETIGSHTVRNNHIHHCGQTGIVGSLGCAFSIIDANIIHDCNLQGIWGGAEMAGIKLHAAIDVVIQYNHVYRCGEPAGIWLDWMAQGTQILSNLLHDNERDIFTEVSHGPILIANNILLSQRALLSNSRGVVVAHNLIVGDLEVLHDDRETPYLEPHSTRVHEMKRVCTVGDAHWLNNILGPNVDLAQYDKSVPGLPSTSVGNQRLYPAVERQTHETRLATALQNRGDEWLLSSSSAPEWFNAATPLLLEAVGVARVPGQSYANPAGISNAIDRDYFSHPRGATQVTPGPFERPAVGTLAIWPRAADTRSEESEQVGRTSIDE